MNCVHLITVITNKMPVIQKKNMTVIYHRNQVLIIVIEPSRAR